MHQPQGKSLKKRLRALAELSYARELTSALTGLESQFASWRAGQLDPFDLSDRVHAFHDGPARDLYKMYVLGDVDWVVASAIARGIVNEVEAGTEVMTTLSARIAFARSDEEASTRSGR